MFKFVVLERLLPFVELMVFLYFGSRQPKGRKWSTKYARRNWVGKSSSREIPGLHSICWT
jgi:hypothetical protein